MSDKHPHQELALKFWADPTQEWRWKYESPDDKYWSDWADPLSSGRTPDFNPDCQYELRPCAAKRPKRMRYPGGTLTFPAPETEPLNLGDRYFSFKYNEVQIYEWYGSLDDFSRINMGIVHSTIEAAKEHVRAFAELKPVEVEE